MVLAPYILQICRTGALKFLDSHVSRDYWTNVSEGTGSPVPRSSRLYVRYIVQSPQRAFVANDLALIIAIAYTYSQDNRGRKIKFFIISMDVKWLPYAMLFLNFILNGMPSTQVQAMGIPAAHLYDFLTRLWPTFGGGRNLLPTPAFVSRWFGGASGSDRIIVKKHATVYRPPPTTTSSFSGGWGSRGQGRRLGGN